MVHSVACPDGAAVTGPSGVVEHKTAAPHQQVQQEAQELQAGRHQEKDDGAGPLIREQQLSKDSAQRDHHPCRAWRGEGGKPTFPVPLSPVPHPSDASTAFAPPYSIPSTSPSSLGPLRSILLLFLAPTHSTWSILAHHPTRPHPLHPVQDIVPPSLHPTLPSPALLCLALHLPVPSCPGFSLSLPQPLAAPPLVSPPPALLNRAFTSPAPRLPVDPSSLPQLPISQELPQPLSSAHTLWAASLGSCWASCPEMHPTRRV